MADIPHFEPGDEALADEMNVIIDRVNISHSPLFQTRAERDAYFPTAPPNGTRCYIRHCEWFYRAGVGWTPVPITQGYTIVQAAVAGVCSRTWDIPFQSIQSFTVNATQDGFITQVQTVDPASYNANIEARWVTTNAGTWRYEVVGSGFLDGFSG